MLLHEIKPKHHGKEKRTRVGRGGKRGTTSGKGTKGQKSRSGRRIRPAIRDLIQRLPKRRGYANKPLEAGNQVINLKDLEKVSGVITLASLIKARVVKTGEKRIKILSNGEIKKAVEIKGIPVSAEARKKIEAAGGKITS